MERERKPSYTYGSCEARCHFCGPCIIIIVKDFLVVECTSTMETILPCNFDCDAVINVGCLDLFF